MADVNERGRGQMILVTGLTLAVILVALALVLNTAIYTENLATRSDDPGASEALRYFESADHDVGEGLDRTSSQDELETFVTEWDRSTGREGARDGVRTSVTLDEGSVVTGTRVYDTDETTTLPGDDADEEFLEGSRIRGFRVTANLDAGESFTVRFDGDGAGTTVEGVDASTVRVSTDEESCEVAVSETGTVTVDFSARTVTGDGDPRGCSALDYTTDFGGTYDLEFENTGVPGTFEFVTDSEVGYEPDEDGEDTVQVEESVYSATVEATYDDGHVSASRDIRVAPREVGA
ncbi:DUF7261 family protein [Halomarina ordinaria]|uniref:Type IV pilin n=1 Tax=Halomarina ordinaria TaxID=3033939 RepID=A0ABD5U6L9_9EURY|nr:hypothetical protein [Halomarina sp. PSRA2]